jgi:hypothetical protein
VRFLKSGEFWAGVVTGYLLVVLVPSLSFRAGKLGARAGMS